MPDKQGNCFVCSREMTLYQREEDEAWVPYRHKDGTTGDFPCSGSGVTAEEWRSRSASGSRSPQDQQELPKVFEGKCRERFGDGAWYPFRRPRG